MTDENTGLEEDDAGGYVVDFNEVEEASFELIPRGKYPVIVDDLEYKLSQSSGLPMWAFVLIINGGEYDGRKLFYNASFSPKALPYTKKMMAVAMPDIVEKGRFDPADDDLLNELRGRSFTAEVKIGKNQDNEKRSEVKTLAAPSDDNAFMSS